MVRVGSHELITTAAAPPAWQAEKFLRRRTTLSCSLKNPHYCRPGHAARVETWESSAVQASSFAGALHLPLRMDRQLPHIQAAGLCTSLLHPSLMNQRC